MTARAIADEIRRVATGPTPAAQRLSYAETSICLRVAGSDDAVTMRFDCDPVEAVEGVHASEVELTLDARQLERFGAGDLDVQRALLDGSISHRGPVWKFLRVMPILTTLLRPDGERSSALPTNGRTARATNGSLDGLWAVECRDL